MLIYNGSTVGASGLRYVINSDTGSNYSVVAVYNTSSFSATAAYASPSVVVRDGRSVVFSQFMDYSATDKHKTILTRTAVGLDFVEMNANRWGNTAAITSIQFIANDQNFNAGSTFALYGIAS